MWSPTGAYKSLSQQTLPDSSSTDFIPALLYKARSLIALNDSRSALSIIPKNSDNIAVKAVASLARYVDSSDSPQAEAALEELRDLAVEIESEDFEGSDRDKALVRVLSATAFARAGEVEEALETLNTETEDLEACVSFQGWLLTTFLTTSYFSVALLVQIYLSINRPDLAKRQFDRSKRWAEDDLLLQSIESMIGLTTGKDNYANSFSFYTEQLSNPSLTSPHLLTARGITRILRGEIQEAKSDLDESLEQRRSDSETEAAYIVAAGLGALKRAEAEELWL